jgi:hypothetical protein
MRTVSTGRQASRAVARAASAVAEHVPCCSRRGESVGDDVVDAAVDHSLIRDDHHLRRQETRCLEHLVLAARRGVPDTPSGPAVGAEIALPQLLDGGVGRRRVRECSELGFREKVINSVRRGVDLNDSPARLEHGLDCRCYPQSIHPVERGTEGHHREGPKTGW